MGAETRKVGKISELETALGEAREAAGPFVIVIDTDPYPSTQAGGTWWDVAVPEVSGRESVRKARESYLKNLKLQRAI
jgi:3D-(3,5/4)-trihydroxycyclohexane-1,2-dione acylhydrolase (decyclizing)